MSWKKCPRGGGDLLLMQQFTMLIGNRFLILLRMAHHACGVVAHLRRLPLLEGGLDESRTRFPWRQDKLDW